jgi:tungstate transport system ATP-binding protein
MKDPAVPALEVRDLLVGKGDAFTLSIGSFQVCRGEILGIVGPNGAGKTTFLHVLSLLEKPSRGELFYEGERVDFAKNLTPFRRRTGVVFQNPLLFDTTVYKNIAAGLSFRRVNSLEIRKRVRAAMEQLGILPLGRRSARKLSGGEASRVALARAFVLEPEILFLDEPFSSLDPPTRESLFGDLQRILGETRVTTVFITHDSSEAIRLADRIAVMDRGKILQAGPVEEVVNFPCDETVARFVGVETILPCKVLEANGGSFQASIGGRVIEAVGEVSPGEDIVLCIRPENVTLSVAEPAKGSMSARNVFPATVKKIVSLGHYFKFYLDCGFALTAYVTKHSLEELSLREGSRVTAHFKATAIHVIRKNTREIPW